MLLSPLAKSSNALSVTRIILFLINSEPSLAPSSGCLRQHSHSKTAVLEWECCLKHPEDGAREGSEFIKNNMIRVTDKAFDDFASGDNNIEDNKEILGID